VVAVMRKLLCSVAAVGGLLGLSVSGVMASPAVFQLSGGDSTFTLPNGPATSQTFTNGLSSSVVSFLSGFGITNGTTVDQFNSANASSGGLFVEPEHVTLTYTFIGASAADINFSEASLVPFAGAGQLSNKDAFGTSVTQAFDVGTPPGLVPFEFKSVCFNTSTGCTQPAAFRYAVNNGPIDEHMDIAYYIPQNPSGGLLSNTVFAFLEDSQLNNGLIDYNDMIVEITGQSTFLGTPLPTTLALFAGGLGLLGFAGRKRKQKMPAVTSGEAIA
jgi:PEP-CTERM motif